MVDALLLVEIVLEGAEVIREIAVLARDLITTL